MDLRRATPEQPDPPDRRPVPAHGRWCQLREFGIRLATSSRFSFWRSARWTSTCELTETYSPAAMAIDPAASPATPAMSTAPTAAPLAATPTTKLAVETSPSWARSTAARNHPACSAVCLHVGSASQKMSSVDLDRSLNRPSQQADVLSIDARRRRNGDMSHSSVSSDLNFGLCRPVPPACADGLTARLLRTPPTRRASSSGSGVLLADGRQKLDLLVA